MKYLKRFDFLFEGLILEKVVVCSDELVKILKTMESPVAKTLLKAQEESADVVDNSYIDFDKEDGLVSYLPANREINRDNGQEIADKWNVRGRQKISIGKLAKAIVIKLGVHYSESEIEKFVNEYKSKQKPTRFVLAKDEASIKKYYYEDNYDRFSMVGDSSLINSCMRGTNAQDFFSIYYNNDTPCKLLVLLNNENNKVMGRAIIWDNVIDNNDNGKIFTFMDRIYTIDSALEESFKAYAREIGWWYKETQSSGRYAITDGKTSKELPLLKVSVPNIEWDAVEMPYMDTFAYLGYEYIDGKFQTFLYNEVYKSSKLHNWYLKFRSQSGGNEEKIYYNRNKDVFGNRIINPNAKVLKEYDDYVWMIDDDNDDLLDPNNFETVYILFKKNRNGIGDAIVALGIDNTNDEADGLCVVETAIYENRFGDYISFSSEIADIVKQQNNLIKYKDWEYDGNFKIPGHIKDPEILNTILNHTDKQWIEHGIALYEATNKECAEVILKYKPDILKNNNVSNLLSLMKYGLIENNNIGDKIKKCGVSDLVYKDDFLWVSFEEYIQLIFMFNDSDKVYHRISSRKYAKDILSGSWDYGYIEYSLNDIDFSTINEKNRETILTLMENDIAIIKSWFEENELVWNDNWKDIFRNNISGKLIRLVLKTDYKDISDAIKYSMNNAQENADLEQAYDKITDRLVDITTIVMDDVESGPRFQFKYEWLIAVKYDDKKILNAIKRYYEDWEDFNIDEPRFTTVNIPHRGWQGDVSNAQFNEELQYRLGEI